MSATCRRSRSTADCADLERLGDASLPWITDLVFEIAAPGENGTIARDHDVVVRAAGNRRDPRQCRDQRRFWLDVPLDACLAVGCEAPGQNGTVRSKSEAVGLARADGSHHAKSLELVGCSRRTTATKLFLIVQAPRPWDAARVQPERVRAAKGHSSQWRQPGNAARVETLAQQPSKLAVATVSPRPQRVVRGKEGSALSGAGSYRARTLENRCGVRSGSSTGIAQLTLEIQTPSPDHAIGSEYEEVIPSNCQGRRHDAVLRRSGLQQAKRRPQNRDRRNGEATKPSRVGAGSMLIGDATVPRPCQTLCRHSFKHRCLFFWVRFLIQAV